MELIEDNPAARWLPSRHRFALARLIAFVIHRRTSTTMTVEHLLLAIDRDQSAIETYAISIWVFMAATAYLTVFVPLPVAILLAGVVLQLPVYFGASSFVMMLLQFCAAAYFAAATVGGPVHYIALLSLIIFSANSVAWIIDRALGI